jgi:hypothetical protein
MHLNVESRYDRMWFESHFELYYWRLGRLGTTRADNSMVFLDAQYFSPQDTT